MNYHKILGLALSGTLLCGAAAAAAEAGSSGDPLVSLNWLQTVFVPQAVSEAQTRVQEKTEAIYQKAVQGQTVSNQPYAEREVRLKQGDRLTLQTGMTLTPLDGDLSAEVRGAVVDLTEGTEAAQGFTAVKNHRYLIAEQTTAVFTVASDTAVVRTGETVQLTPGSGMDYYKLADALKAMGLFRGTGTPYGDGYDLEKVPTRIEGLIMFLRLMGEESAALSHIGTVNFADVPGWALPYASYAFDKGYTKGTGTDEQGRVIFGTQNVMSSGEYMVFLLRALGYQEGSAFGWQTAITDGANLGVLTPGEEARLKTGDHFHRAQVAYLSYVGLSARFADGSGTLLDRLLSTGAVSGFVDAGLTRF